MNKIDFVNRLVRVLSNYMDKLGKNKIERNILNSYSKLSSKKELTKEQEKEISEYFYKLLGHKVSTTWHKYFYSRTGYYSKYYIPSSEYFMEIIGRLNIYPLKRAYTDKNLINIILPASIQPKVFLKNINGYYYFEEKPVSREEALSLCANIGEVIVKPSLLAKGKGVSKHVIENGASKNISKQINEIFDEYRQDFIIQECVHQHESMAALNPTSLNTIRIVSFRSDMDIKIIYSVIRIGRKGAVVDNESAGGISTIINKDGTLGQYAYGSPGVDKVQLTDTGVCLSGYKVPSYEEALKLVKTCHYQLPYFDLLGWDIAINEQGSPVLIEFNISPDLSQSANGPAFGEYTEEIISKAMKRNNTYTELGKNFIWRSF